jgi:hypothetical protein
VTDAGDCSLPVAQPGPLRFAGEPGQHPGTPQAWTRRLLRCGVAAGPVFVAVFLLEGAVRDGYRPLRHPVSSLALGPRGWIQAGNFAIAGMLFLAGAAGLARAGDPAAGRAVTMLTTIALAGAGFGQSPRLINLGGLFQRASIITGFAWLTALSAEALRRTPTIAAPRHQAG